MTISGELWQEVRGRAQFACEYCGVTESDVGGELTVDHFRPQAHGGSDDPTNLLYCCHRCNLYKADFWPFRDGNPALWNPRQGPAEHHWLALSDGTLYPLTPTGTFTVARLRLNRPPLVAYRTRKLRTTEELRLLSRYKELVALLEQLHQQEVALLEEHRALLDELRVLLNLRLRREH